MQLVRLCRQLEQANILWPTVVWWYLKKKKKNTNKEQNNYRPNRNAY